MKKLNCLLAVCFCLAGCSLFPPDNPVEELIEDEIKAVTGLDIDLSADDEKI